MNKRDTVRAIKAMGMTAKWDSEWQEFIINYNLNDDRRTAESSYHTEDSDDAIETAKMMSNWHAFTNLVRPTE